MADLSDVLNTLVSAVTSPLYPTAGTNSAAGMPVRIYAGWPNPQTLDADLASGIAHVSVYAMDVERNTTRYQESWEIVTFGVPTISASVTGQAITLMGSVSAGNVIAVQVQRKSYVYALVASDTLSSVATSLAALIAADYPGTAATGAVITLTPSANLNAVQAGAPSTVLREIKRQERQFLISIWASTPTTRDAIAKILDPALSDPRFITLPDGSGGRIIYQGSRITDEAEKKQLYRRDLRYSVEYGTTVTQILMPVLTNILNVSSS